MTTNVAPGFLRRILLFASVMIAACGTARAQAPVITTQPVTQAIAPGGSLTLSVAATGSGTLTYQWSRNGVPVVGATNASLPISNAQLANAGRYSVTVTNAAGTVTSAPAQVNLTGVLWFLGYNVSNVLYARDMTAQTSPVQVASNVSAVGAGGEHLLYLKTDGTLWAMGSNYTGALGDGTTTGKTSPVQVASGVTAVTAAGGESFYLKTDGTLWAMGANSGGALGDGTTNQRNSPVQVASGVSAAAAGYYHSLYLKPDGTLWAMGSNSYGQLGDGTTIQRNSPVQVVSSVSAMAAGSNHSLYLKSDGTLWAMGWNHLGELGDGTTTQRNTPVQVAGGVSAIAAGYNHSLYLKTDGTLWAMGYNSRGQLGDGTTIQRNSPVIVTSNVLSVAAGYGSSYFIQTIGGGTVPTVTVQPAGGTYSSGASASLTVVATGPGPLDYRWRKDGIDLPGTRSATLYFPILKISDAASYSVVVTNSAGSVTSSDARLTVNVPPVTPTITITTQPVTQAIVLGGALTLSAAATGSGTLTYQWSRNGVAIDGATNSSYSISNAQLGNTGRYSVAVTDANGTITSAPAPVNLTGLLWAMGWNYYGQLGDGTTTQRNAPVQVAGGVSAVTAGYAQSLYLKTDGTLWTMGSNSQGQLGDGTTTDRNSPVQVASGVSAVAAGGVHSFYLRTDGTLWAMGYNGKGQLGDGTTTQRNAPVQVAGSVSAVVAGGDHSLYLNTDGTLSAMGDNSQGQLGDGTTTQRNTPVQVAVGVSAMAAGGFHSLYLKTNGTLWAMGANYYGQLGDGTTTQRNIPVQVADGVGAVAAGEGHSLFLKTDGTLWAMGDDSEGQLGTTPQRNSPVQVASAVSAVAAGWDHSLYLKADGTLWAMGENFFGQLGDGTRTQRNSPVKVAGNVLSMAASFGSSYFVQAIGVGATFGTFGGNGGTFALFVRPDGSGVFLGYARGANVAFVSRDVVVDSNRHFQISASPLTALAAVDGHPIAATLNGYAITGTISDNGTISGSVSGLNLTLSAPAAQTSGTSATAAGFYQAGAPGSSATSYAIVGAAGDAYVATVSGTNADAGIGFIDATGRVVVITENNARVSGTIDTQARTISLGVTPSTGTAVTFIGANNDARADVEKLVNLSTRSQTGTAANVLIVGFFLAGDLPKPVLVRAIGPTLANFGVNGTLSAARLEVFKGSTSIAVGTDWGSGANATTISTAAARVGAFPLPASSRDAALLLTLDPGGYSAVVSGQGSAAGVSLVEVYDATSGAIPRDQRIINLSTRATAGTGDSTLIAGFVISGTVPKRVLIRGVGPSLAQFGVSGVLARPQLSVNSGSTTLAQNAGWSTSPDASAIAAGAAQVGAFAFGATSQDAALIVNLSPGPYTAQVSGVGGTTGVALIEVYELP